MIATATLSRSGSSTVTEARVRKVMLEVSADFINIAIAGIRDLETCKGWARDMTFLLEQEAVERFQIQFRIPSKPQVAVEYVVRADGTLQASDAAGGIDYILLPTGTTAHLFVSLKDGAYRWPEVDEYLNRHGWGRNGQAVTGSSSQDRVFSSDGYGVVRNKIGEW